MDKNFYNEASAVKLGWDPTWFGEKYFDEDLVKAVQKWQRKYSIKSDGLVGPMTHRRVWTERQSRIQEFKPYLYPLSDQNFIVHNGNFIPIQWKKVVLWSEDHGFKSNPGNYYNYEGKPDREPTIFVNHWDVCLSSASCASVLNKRGISVHFLIDNDGTIFQMLDTQHGAWHAGSGKVNRKAVGVEISNAYYTKYQSWYMSHGFGERQVLRDVKVHGKKLKPFLGFYDVQIEAAKALWQAISYGLNIPLQCPTNSSGEMLGGLHDDSISTKFSGFVHHYHVSRRKIDCGGFDLVKHLQEAKDVNYCYDK